MEHIDIERWRARYRNFLDNASRIIATSQWARDTLTKYYPGIQIDLAPPWPGLQSAEPARAFPDVFQLPADECRHIGVLGAIGPEKGARHLDAMVARIRERRLPLRLVVVGYTDREQRFQSSDKVLTIQDLSTRSRAATRSLPDRNDVFPTVWPETFSYTLSEDGWRASGTGTTRGRVAGTGSRHGAVGSWRDGGWIRYSINSCINSGGGERELQRKVQRAKTAFREAITRRTRRQSLSDMLRHSAAGEQPCHAVRL